MSGLTLEEQVAAHRRANPRSRAVGVFRYVLNTGSRRRMGCVLCRAQGPTWCGDYPKTQRAVAWEREHLEQHRVEVIAWVPELAEVAS